MAVRADSVGLHLSTGFVPYGDIESLELKVGSRSWWHVGLLVGLGAGAGVGRVVATKVANAIWAPILPARCWDLPQ